MQVKIYQINSDRDEKRVKFTASDRLSKYQGGEDINASIYDEVFSGEMDVNDLEDIYTLLNTDGHPLFRGHKLSVSDVVVVEGGAPELFGRIRFYNSSTAFEECEYTDKLRFESDIREALYVGRTISSASAFKTFSPTIYPEYLQAVRRWTFRELPSAY